MHVCSVMSNSLTPYGMSRPGSSLSMGFPRQEYWSGLPFPPPGDLPDPRIEPGISGISCIASEFFTTEPPGKPQVFVDKYCLY